MSNPSGGAVTFTMSVGADAAATRVYTAVPIGAGSFFFDYPYLELDAGDILQVSSDTNNVLVLTVGGDALSGGGGSQAVLMSSTTLTSAEIIDLVTPVELLPAPGGRFYYAVMYMIFHYRFGTVPYTGSFNDDLRVAYGTDYVDQSIAYPPLAGAATWGALSALLQQTEDAYLWAGKPDLANDYVGWRASDIENKPVSFYRLGGVGFAAGDGTLTIRTFYALIDGA